MPPSRSLIRSTVEAYLERHPDERSSLDALLTALDRPADPTSRTTLPGHVTCGAILIDDTGRVLHIHHRASGKVLAPGGHTEPGDETLAAAALRELHEEAGIPPHAVSAWPGYASVPLDIDVHDIDARPAKNESAHQHYDLCFPFRLVEREAATTLQAEEVAGWEWRSLDRVTSPTLREKLLKLGSSAAVAEPVNASALIHNDAGQYLLHLRDDVPGIWEPGAWSLLGGGREAQDRSLEETVRRELREEASLDLPDLEPFAVEEARSDDGATISIAIYSGRWNGAPADLTLTEGVMLAWFDPEVLPRLRISPSTVDLVKRHAARAGGAAGLASGGSGLAGTPRPPTTQPGPVEADIWETVGRLARLFEAHDGARGLDQAQQWTLQVLKIAEETGEASQAVIGARGTNPRKGDSHTWQDVHAEVADVVITGMVALARMRPDDAEHYLQRQLDAKAATFLPAASSVGLAADAETA